MKLGLIFIFLILLLLYGKFIKGYRVVDMLSPKKWKSVSISLLKKLLLKLDGPTEVVPLYIAEQYVYRELACPSCVVAGKCINCNCDSELKMLVATETCNQFNWYPIMHDEKDWIQFKIDNKIQFKLR